MFAKPRLIILADPNGSGKSSLPQLLIQHEWGKGCQLVNADNIAQGIGSWNDPDSTRLAQRIAFVLLDEARG